MRASAHEDDEENRPENRNKDRTNAAKAIGKESEHLSLSHTSAATCTEIGQQPFPGDTQERARKQENVKVDGHELTISNVEIDEEMTRQQLRVALKQTQIEVAKTLGIAQDSVSRLEKRAAVLLLTLRGYIKALGRRVIDCR